MPLTDRLLHATALLGTAAGLALLLAAPGVAILGWGHALLPATVHLFTLGGVLSAAYALQGRLWRQLYGPIAPWPPLLAGAWALHAAGVLLLAWGLIVHDTRLAYWGGHYLVPTGVVVALAHGWVAAWRRPRGAARRPAAHLPGIGLAVTMSIGALLVMDAHTVRYGIYTLETILAHVLAAGFLFVLPQVLLPEALRAQQEADDAAGAGRRAPLPVALLRWYAAVATGAGGVLLAVLALLPDAHPRLLVVGLAMLGALLVWLGLPGPRAAAPPGRGLGATLVPLAGRLATGVLLFYAALRLSRMPLPGEGLWLAKLGVLLFGLGVALPELLALLERHGDRAGAGPQPGRTLARQGVWLAGTAVLLAGQLWAAPWLVRLGALIWLGGLGWYTAAAWRR